MMSKCERTIDSLWVQDRLPHKEVVMCESYDAVYRCMLVQELHEQKGMRWPLRLRAK